MNPTNQIHAAEHSLKQISGHSIVASKKKRKTCQNSSSTDSPSNEAYSLPRSFTQFCKQLEDTCAEGDKESKEVIAQLAPEIEKSLKEIEEWDNPSIPISPPPTDLQRLTTLDSGELSTPSTYTAEEIDSIISPIVGPITESSLNNTHTRPDVEQAYANYVTDVSYDMDDSTRTTPTSVSKLVSGLQPYREKPSKDRTKCFATGNLPFDRDIPESHDRKHQHWSLLPNKAIRSAKVFLLCQIMYISEEGKPVTSSIKANPNTSVVVNLTLYQPMTAFAVMCITDQ